MESSCWRIYENYGAIASEITSNLQDSDYGFIISAEICHHCKKFLQLFSYLCQTVFDLGRIRAVVLPEYDAISLKFSETGRQYFL